VLAEHAKPLILILETFEVAPTSEPVKHHASAPWLLTEDLASNKIYCLSVSLNDPQALTLSNELNSHDTLLLFIFVYYYYLFKLQMGFYPVAVVLQ
jgi:hypothetical protein